MRITMSGGGVFTLPGCLARFGAGFGIIAGGYELTHVIKRGRLFRLTGPAGCKPEHLGIVDRIEV